MAEVQHVLEYKCPCCGAGLEFSSTAQKLSCNACDNEFEIDAIKDYNDSLEQSNEDSFQWDQAQTQQWSEEEQERLRVFVCPSCAGEIITDDHTAATFCPYCENPAILPGRVSGALKPDAVIPFQTTKDDAKNAFLQLCKGKPLLPREFTQEHRLEKITGMYVPFWLYSCDTALNGRYKATRVHRWSDSRYHYTRTDHYLLTRQSVAKFDGIPMDGSSKLDNTVMESIEPFDYGKLMDFDTAYLSGFLADKYDVESALGEERVRQRVNATMEDLLQPSMMGYANVIPTARQLHVNHGKAKYVLLPVWMLHTKYRDKTYVFAMNGQSGKMTGSLPICPKRSWTWFGGIAAGVTLLVTLILLLGM